MINSGLTLTADMAPVGSSQLMSPLVQVHSPINNATSPELLAKLAMLRHSAEKVRCTH